MTNEEFEKIKAGLKEKHGCRDCKFNCKDADFWMAPCPDYIKKEEAK